MELTPRCVVQSSELFRFSRNNSQLALCVIDHSVGDETTVTHFSDIESFKGGCGIFVACMSLAEPIPREVRLGVCSHDRLLCGRHGDIPASLPLPLRSVSLSDRAADLLMPVRRRPRRLRRSRRSSSANASASRSVVKARP
jgi:hypothetical protein